MNDSSDSQTIPRPMEEGIQVLLNSARQGIRHRYEKCEMRIRNSPKAAVLGAVATGYFLHQLPVRAIVVTQVRVLSALAQPALILYGAAKLYDFLQRQGMEKHE